MKNQSSAVIPFLLLSMLALIMGLWAGLARIGWQLPVLPATLPLDHGPLMISGFLGTLIALERVAALRQRWMFGAPILSGIGWLVSLILTGSLIGPIMITLGSLVTLGILIVIVRRESKIYTLTMAVGVACWLIGNLLWVFGFPVFLVVWLWAAFLVLTIAGERLELSRILRFKTWHYRIFALAAGIFLLGAILYLKLPKTGAFIIGIGLASLAAWLIRFDIARRNLHHPSALTQFIAVCLFSGFIWLGISGVLNLAYGPQYGGAFYDAELHSIFVGFVFSMIFGHALIILPALTQITVPFRKSFYLPLALLHSSLILRICGDMAGWAAGRMLGGILNETAILAFMGLFIYTIAARKKNDTPRPSKTR